MIERRKGIFMNIALGADHRGFELKEEIKLFLKKAGHQVKDVGCFNREPCDYPDFALLAAEAVSTRDYERGILCCATGVGMSIAANKIPGIRAALVYDEQIAFLVRKHNKANILCLGSEIVNKDKANQIIENWIRTPFSKEERHICRIEKIMDIEKKYFKKK